MTEIGSICNFKKHFQKMRIPLAVYADFECIAKPTQSCQPNSEHSFTQQYQHHEPSGFCYYIACYGKELEPVLY